MRPYLPDSCRVIWTEPPGLIRFGTKLSKTSNPASDTGVHVAFRRRTRMVLCGEIGRPGSVCQDVFISESPPLQAAHVPLGQLPIIRWNSINGVMIHSPPDQRHEKNHFLIKSTACNRKWYNSLNGPLVWHRKGCWGWIGLSTVTASIPCSKYTLGTFN